MDYRPLFALLAFIAILAFVVSLFFFGQKMDSLTKELKKINEAIASLMGMVPGHPERKPRWR